MKGFQANVPQPKPGGWFRRQAPKKEKG